MKYLMMLMTSLLLLAMPTMAKPLQIIEIPNASLVEVQNIKSKEWLTVSELDFQLPVSAKVSSGSERDLVFAHAGTQYLIASSDVMLAGESIVQGCSGVINITQVKDSRSASTRGAVEPCN